MDLFCNSMKEIGSPSYDQLTDEDISRNYFLAQQHQQTTTTDESTGILYSDTNPPIIAICTDLTRAGAAIYFDSQVQLVADRKDAGDPYKGLDIIIQKMAPDKVIVSSVQKRLIAFLEKCFKFETVDLSIKKSSKFRPSTPISHIAALAATQHLESRASSQETTIVGQVANEAHIPEQDLVETNTNNSIDKDFTLVIVQQSWFSMSKAMHKLVESEMVQARNFSDLEQKSVFIHSKIDKSVDVCAVRSIAALEAYIEHENTIALNPENPESTQVNSRGPTQQQTQHPEESTIKCMPILDIGYVDAGPVMSIDRGTLSCLRIFGPSLKNKAVDPNIDEQTNQAVPTLFELLNQCSSPQGKRHLHTIMMWPLQDIIQIEHRLQAVEFFANPDHKHIVDQLRQQMKNVVPLSGLLLKLSHSTATYRELTTLYKAIWAFLAILDLIRSIDTIEIEVFNRLVILDSEDFRNVVGSTLGLIDFDASRIEKQVQVNFGVNQTVDDKKEILKNLCKFCNDVAVQETAKYRDTIGKLFTVSYIPRIGFLNSVEYSNTTELLDIKSNPGFDVLLNSDRAVYFKTSRMEELDANAGDILCDLIDSQEAVLLEIQNELLKHSDTILKLTDLCGELDCLVSFAVVSRDRCYTRPQLAPPDHEIDLRQAYHPLHSVRNNFIPNDIHFYKLTSGRKARVMVITGPNSSGKTTIMKTTCLVIYMAQIGCFVPASDARIPIVDAILTRMRSADSVSTGLSTFATDVYQVNYALNRATERSIIAIDEFGKGTHAKDGFHLLKGLIMHLAERGEKCPYVMVASHFTHLVDHLQSYSEFIMYKTLKVTRNLTKDSIFYEFTMIDGVGESTLADEVALRAGLPEQLIDRARQIREYITHGRPVGARPPTGA